LLEPAEARREARSHPKEKKRWIKRGLGMTVQSP